MTFSRFTALLLLLSACSFKGTEQITAGAENPRLALVVDSSSGTFDGENLVDPTKSVVSTAFSARVKLLDSATLSKLPPQHAFEVLVSDTPAWPASAKGQQVRSTADGEVLVQGAVEYAELGAERYFTKYLLLRNLEAPFAGEVSVVKVQINPWQRGDLFFRDVATEGSSPYTGRQSTKSQLVLSSYNATFLERKFELNEHLELTTLRYYALNLRPGLARQDANGEVHSVALRPGTRFRIVGILEDPTARGREPLNGFLSAFETEAEVEIREGSGIEINATAVLAVDFTQQPRLDSRTRLHLRLEPLEQGPEAPRPALLSTSFVANPNGNDTTSGSVVALDRSVEASKLTIPTASVRPVSYPHGTSYALKIGWSASPMAMLAAYWKGFGPLVTVASTPPDASWISPNQWWKSTQASPDLLKSLMEFVDGDGSDVGSRAEDVLGSFCSRIKAAYPTHFAACTKHPGDFFHLSHFTVVEKVMNTQPSISSVNNSFLIFATSYFNETQLANRISHATKTGTQWSGGITAKLGYEIMGSGGGAHTSLTRESEWFRAEESALVDSTRSRVSAQEQVTVSTERVELDLDVMVRRCALIRPLRFELAVSEAAGKPIASTLICSDPLWAPRSRESWYAVRDRWNSVHSAHSDPKNPVERGWTKLVRGNRGFGQFKEAIGDKTRSYVFSRIEPFFDGVDNLAASAFTTPKQLERLTRDGGIFPGVLDFSESSSLRWREAQIVRYTELCMDPVRKTLPTDSVGLRTGLAHCRCLSETAARRWDHGAFVQKAKEYGGLLLKDGTSDRCLAFAKAQGSNK